MRSVRTVQQMQLFKTFNLHLGTVAVWSSTQRKSTSSDQRKEHVGMECSFFNILNRGNKGGIAAFNANVPPNLTEINAVANPGDGFMLGEGYTLVWFGWQADVLPGNNRLTLSVPIARHQDGSAITGPVRAELTTLTPAKTLNLSSGWFTALTHASYPTAQIRQS